MAEGGDHHAEPCEALGRENENVLMVAIYGETLSRELAVTFSEDRNYVWGKM